jgi:putative sterol carrier protein
MRCCLLLVLLALPFRLGAMPAIASYLPVANTPTGADNVNTTDEVFAEMRKSFRADKARGVHLRYQFRFAEPQAGNWWIVVADGAFTMGKGEIAKADVTFSSSGADWVKLSNGTLSGFRAYLTGRLHVAGSQEQARKLDEMFP